MRFCRFEGGWDDVKGVGNGRGTLMEFDLI